MYIGIWKFKMAYYVHICELFIIIPNFFKFILLCFLRNIMNKPVVCMNLVENVC